MSLAYRLFVVVVLIAYLVTIAILVFSPTSETPWAAVRWTHNRLLDLGAPPWLTANKLEFVSNVVLFIPLTFLASLLFLRGSWVWWTVAGFVASLSIETVQALLLTGRIPTLADVVANTLGALAGALLAVPLCSWVRERLLERAATQFGTTHRRHWL